MPVVNSSPNLIQKSFSHFLGLALLNARSILNKMSQFRTFVALHNPDVVLVTESWCTSDTTDAFLMLNGYHFFRTNRDHGRGGGCLVYISNSLSSCQFEHPYLNSVNDSIWLSVTTYKLNILIGCIYHRPTSNNFDTARLLDAFNCASYLPHHLKIVGGDFNMPGINWVSNPPTSNSTPIVRELLSCINLAGWTQHVQKPTRLDNILDLIFTIGFKPRNVEILKQLPGCDHKIVIANLEYKSFFEHNLPTPPSIRRMDWAKLPTLLRHSEWDKFFLSNDCNTAALIFLNNFNACTEKLLPMHSITNNRNHTTYYKASMKLKKLRRNYLKIPDISILMSILSLVNSIEQSRKKSLIAEESKALAHSQKSIQLLHLKKRRMAHRSQNISFIHLEDGSTVSDPLKLCKAFNSHFAKNFNPHDSIVNSLPLLDKFTSKSFESINIDINSIRTAISAIRPSLYLGPDGIPPLALKLEDIDLPLFFLKMFSLSIQSGVFPKVWKNSIIIPRHKFGPKHNIDNFRPINHTSIISRTLERIVKSQLTNYLTSINFINDSQHGFLHNRSCVSSHVSFFDHITKATDNGNALVIIILDIQKAFDRVPHTRLLLKLESIGICGNLLKWFTSYLEGRRQYVKIGSYVSDPTTITSGVIQGSVLGPLLFLIYINDISTILSHGRLFMFADDLKLVYQFDPKDSTYTNLIHNDLRALESWSKVWLMNFSATKSNVISYRFPIPAGYFTLNNVPISNPGIICDLGIRYSCTFKFNEQVVFKIAKAKQSLAYLSQLFLLPNSKLEMYKVFIRPIFEYCSFIYGQLRKCDRVAYENVQRSFTKSLVGYSSSLNYRQRCVKLGLDPLWLRRLKLNLILLFKIIHGLCFSSNLTTQLYEKVSYPIRNKSVSLKLPIFHSKLRSSFFLVRYASIWNSLPVGIRNTSNVHQFKKLLYEFLTLNNIHCFFKLSIDEDTLCEHGLDYI